MAGTIVCDVISDGAGNSTATDNAIYGSAKAWVSYKGTSTQSIYASYNVSSVTYNTTGYYTINYTNAFSDANYCVVATCSKEGSTLIAIANTNNSSARVAPTTSATALSLQQYNGSAGDTAYVYVAVFR